jgi:hypothetical protein
MRIYSKPKACALIRKVFDSFMDFEKRWLGFKKEIMLMKNAFLNKLIRLIFLDFMVWF